MRKINENIYINHLLIMHTIYNSQNKPKKDNSNNLHKKENAKNKTYNIVIMSI